MINRIRAGWRGLRARPVLATVFDVLVVVGVMFAIHTWQTRDLPDNEPAPARALKMLAGNSIQSPIGAGEVGVVYFFAPWCHVCRASISNLDDLLAGGTVTWASAIALDYQNTAEVQQFVDDVGVSMPVFLGEGQEISNWKIRGYPTYFVIDSKGNVDSSSVGYSTDPGLRFRIWWAN